MKKIKVLLVCMVAFLVIMPSNAESTNQDGTIMVRKSDLPPAVLQQLESKQQLADMSQKVEAYGKWVGIGKELGTAMNESLSALTAQADKFSKTDVGRFTMFIVAYKVLGNDVIVVAKKIILIPIACLIIIVATCVCIKSLRRSCWGSSVLETIDADKKKHYKYLPPLYAGDEHAFMSLAHGIGYIIFIAVMFLMFF